MAPVPRHILSFGGGVNTVALMVHLVREGMPFDEAVFADTGGELPETYAYLKIARKWLEGHDKPLKVVRSSNGSLFETCTRRRVVPSQVWRWSTRDYKITPIHAYYRTLGSHINEYMGIAYDEISRMKRSREDFITTLFPLIDARLTREECVSMIKSEGLPVPAKSGCYFCPFNSFDRWRALSEDHPKLYNKAMRLEESSKHFPNQSLVDHWLRRRLGVEGLRELKEEFAKVARVEASADGSPCGGQCMT